VTSGPLPGRDQASRRPERIFGPTYRTLTVGVVSIITVIAFEFMGVVTAMPVAARELGGLSWYAWAFTAFSVTSLYSMVVGGEWADRHGPMRPLVVGASLFAAGLVIAGLARTMPELLLGRAVQGLGSGATVVAVYVVIGRGYPESLRPMMFTALSGAWVIPGIVGPALVGWITDHLGWRWVFLSVVGLMIPIAAVLVPRLAAAHLPGDPTHPPIPGRKRRALLAAFGVVFLQYAAQRHDLASLPLLAVAGACLAFSVPGLLPAGTLRLRRGLPMVVAERGLVAGGFNGAEAFVPLMLEIHRGLTASHAGLAITGAALGWFGGSFLQRRPRSRVARVRLIRVGAWTVAAMVAATSVVVAPSVPPMLAMLTWGAAGFGMGMLYASLGVLLLDYSPPQEQGVNSSAIQVGDSIGMIVFTGLGGAIFATAETSGGATGATFVVIYLLMAAVVAVAASVVGRLLVDTPEGAGAEHRSG
jgi:MFS family permease